MGWEGLRISWKVVPGSGVLKCGSEFEVAERFEVVRFGKVASLGV